MMLPCRLLLSTALVCLAVAAAYTPAGLQSGPDLAGSTFAASVTYDEVTQSVVITGSTYGNFFANHGNAVTSVARETSTCFLATVSLPTATTSISSSTGTMQWKVLQTLGSDEDHVPEACSFATYHQKHSKLIAIGHSEVGGFFNELYDDSQYTPATEYGMLLDMDVSSDATAPFHLVGGRVLQESRVTYPIMLATTPADEWIYVVSQETGNIARNDEGLDTHNSNTVFAVSAEADPMRFFVYGDNYRMSIARYKRYDVDVASNLQKTFEQGWRTILGTSDNSAVHVAGIAEIGDTVVVVGSTQGVGFSFNGFDAIIGDGTMSGFISKFNKGDGQSVNVTGTDNRASHFIQSINGRDDWIAGMCNDPNDLDHFYIVGATEGQLDKAVAGSTANDSTQAFAMKVNVGTLDTVWTIQLGADTAVGDKTKVRAISCTVSPDGGSIWFGGVVQDGAVLKDSGTMESYGGDDVFVAKLRSNDGTMLLVRQIGSSEEDGLAMRGGLAVDKDGNCVVVGNTYGSFYRERQAQELEDQAWISDIFVTTIAGDNGAIAFPVSHPDGTSGKDIVLPSESSNSSNDGGMGPDKIVLLVVGLCGGVLALVFFVRSTSKTNRDATTDRAHVIHFLNEFDVEDIDLKHSATGGWHCSYSNDLANGRNRRAERGSSFGSSETTPGRSMPPGSDPLLTAPLTNSSVLQDSLFMDDDNNSEYGGGLGSGRFDESSSAHRQGYDGLIDAYNSTWDDRRSGQEHDHEHDLWGKEIL